jgi:hypothetical protein
MILGSFSTLRPRAVSAVLTLLLLAICFLPSHIQAQAVSGSITGVILDPSGNVIPGATVKATNSATGVEHSVTTDPAGHFAFSNLIAGQYQLVVTMAGFKTLDQSNVDVSIDKVTRLDLTLQVGSLQESVTVTGAAPQLQVDKVNLGSTLSSDMANRLPTIGNNATALAKLTAGVIEGPGQEGIPSSNGSGYFSTSVNGNREQLNTHLLDGVEDTDPIGGQAPIVPPLDGMQEVSFNTTNYDVEFGQVAGGVTLMTSKSGTNQYHGSGYEYNRMNSMFARNPFTEPNGPGHFVWNQFGGSVGGPILKNKLFGFFNYQGIRVRSGGGVLTTVPIQAFRNGDFSSLKNPIYDPATGGAGGVGRTQFPGNIIPANRINAVAKNVLALLPLPNQPGTDNNYAAPVGHPINQNVYNWRVDYVMNDSNRFFYRQTYTNQNEECPGIFGAGGGPSGCGDTPQIGTGSDNSLAVDYIHVFSPTFVVEGRFGWSDFKFGVDAPDQNTNASEAAGQPGLNDACPAPDCGGLAGFRIGGPVGAFNAGNSDHSHQVDNRGGYNYVGLATWTHGAHTIKFGGDLKWENSHRFDSASMGNFGCFNGGLCSGDGFAQTLTGTPGVESGLGMASFLLGLSSNFQRIIYTTIPPTMLQKRHAFFVQDSWLVSRKLTLTLGLRWDYIGYPTAPYPGGLSNFVFSGPEATNTLTAEYGNVTPQANVQNNYHDFAPRLGIAYRIAPRTVLRIGAGRTHSIGFYGANFGAINNQWPNATRQKLDQPDPYDPAIILGTAPPSFVSGFDILAAAGNPGSYPTPRTSTAFGTDPYNPTHSIFMWNVALQHEFGQNLVATIAYVGNEGRHLFWRRDYNATVPGPGDFLSRKAYGGLGYTTNAYNQSNQSSSGYQGMQLSLEKRMSQGLFLTTALTWGKTYDFGLHNAYNPFNSNLDRALSDSDRALVISVGHVWELPFGPNKKYLNSKGASRHLVGGWEWSGISRWMSGSPFTPIIANGGAILNSDCCTERPNRDGVGTVSNPSRNEWFDRSAFSTPAQYQFGNSGRNILRGPSFNTFDWGLSKNFGWGEQRNIQLKWQIFNVFNQTNLANPNTAIDTSTGGQIFGIVHPMRRQQLGIHIYW